MRHIMRQNLLKINDLLWREREARERTIYQTFFVRPQPQWQALAALSASDDDVSPCIRGLFFAPLFCCFLSISLACFLCLLVHLTCTQMEKSIATKQQLRAFLHQIRSFLRRLALLLSVGHDYLPGRVARKKNFQSTAVYVV